MSFIYDIDYDLIYSIIQYTFHPAIFLSIILSMDM